MLTTFITLTRELSGRNAMTDDSRPQLYKPAGTTIIVLLAVLGGLLSCAGNLQAQAKVTEVEGTSVAVAPYPTDPGVTYFRGPNIHIRDWVSTWHDQTDDPRMTGLTTVFVEVLNIRPDGSSQLRGTYITEVGTWGGANGDEFTPTGGIWVGTWHGKANQPLYLVGHGIAGEVEGLKVRAIFDGSPAGAVLLGEILTPGSK